MSSRSEVDNAIRAAHQARKNVDVAAITASGATVYHRETTTTYRVDAVVERDGERYRVRAVTVIRSDSHDPDDPEPYVTVHANGQRLKADGTPDGRSISTPLHLPAELADRLVELEA